MIAGKRLPLWCILLLVWNAAAAKITDTLNTVSPHPQAQELVLKQASSEESSIQAIEKMVKPKHDNWQELWDNRYMVASGCVSIFLIVAISNAGGSSGAGNTIPLMLIFFQMDMHDIVPVSSFLAVCSTLVRFVINYDMTHPRRKERNLINYEVIEAVMPLVFFGSFAGVFIGKMLSSKVNATIYCVVITWSIVMTVQKYFKLLEMEREQREREAAESMANGPEEEEAALLA